MAGELVDAFETKIMDLLTGVSTAAPVALPLKVALLTALGSDSAAGTEVSGGSYARQNITFAAASAGAASNSALVSFTGMPACVVVGFAIYDNGGARVWNITRAGGSLTVNVGDTVQIAAGAVVLSVD